MRQVVLITGHTCNGKSRLAINLSKRFGFKLFKVSNFLKTYTSGRSLPSDREGLKKIGDELDASTDYRWVFDEVRSFSADFGDEIPVVVDSIRNANQLGVFRQNLDFEVTHVHLYATRNTLDDRLRKKEKKEFGGDNSEDQSYLDLVSSEEDIKFFNNDADVRIFTDRTNHEDTLTRVAAYLGLYPSPRLIPLSQVDPIYSMW